MKRFLANSLWMLSSLPDSLAFHRARRRVSTTQTALLLDLLRRNAQTVIGRRYDFASIRSVADYQRRLPLTTYADYEAAIEQIGLGQSAILTQEPVLLLEPTSGSASATKYIPYTAPLKAEFQRAIAPWVVDTFRQRPALLRGQAYWSVSPVTQRVERTPGGLAIGFEEDSAYLGGLQRHLINAVLAVPSPVRLIEDMPTFRYVTLLFLLRSRSLALISVWNPTFLTLLLAPLPDWWPRLAEDIAQGTLSPPEPLAADLRQIFTALNKPDPRRAAAVRTAFRQETLAATYAHLWPNLRLISCWTEAHAALHVADIAQRFPQAEVQGKGLLATEGVVSFPLAGQPGHALALRSHFFEFLPLGEPEQTILAHELTEGQDYEVVLTTGGGLYRYQLRDVVRVVGHVDDCPLLRFIGKTGLVSDRFGEKLTEAHVQQALGVLFERYEIQPKFAMIAYEETLSAYMLFLEATILDQTLCRLADDLEALLQDNFHYRYCRRLGQLGSLATFRIREKGLATYLAVCQDLGQRSGDIKPVALHRQANWSRFFEGDSLIQLDTKS